MKTTLTNYTIDDHMEGRCTHREYYAQFVTPSIIDYVHSNYTREHIVACLQTDEHLNNLDNNKPRKKWIDRFDNFTRQIAHELSDINFRINGSRSYSLSMGTCAIKEYMKEWAEAKEV